MGTPRRASLAEEMQGHSIRPGADFRPLSQARASDSEMLRFLIENRGVKPAEVAKGTGIAESTISEVLAGKRQLNRNQIGKLARYFHVEPGVFAFGE